MSDDDHFAAGDAAARGRTLRLGGLVILCGISAFTGLIQIFAGSKPALVPLIRFGLSVVLAYFVFNGSLIARVIFAILCVLAALVSLYGAMSLALADFDSPGAGTLLVWGGFYLLAAWAPWSPPIKPYWDSLRPKTADRDT
jgi:hypothetical protein